MNVYKIRGTVPKKKTKNMKKPERMFIEKVVVAEDLKEASDKFWTWAFSKGFSPTVMIQPRSVELYFEEVIY
jgi:hypothetical protein